MAEICILCEAGFPHIPTENCGNPAPIEDVIEEVVRERGRPQSDPSEMADSLSTGRKRAGKIPIPPGMICEWAYLKKAGGGIESIKGCPGYPASDRHHGPDKNTLNNEREDGPTKNLWFICDWCHSRYHSSNDKYYLGGRPKDDTPWLPSEIFGALVPHNFDDKMTKQEALELEIERTSK